MDLVHAIAAQDQRALEALYERAHAVVFTLILRITQSRETAEELLVDVFYDVWRRAAQYDAGGGTVLGWILNQARSRAIDRLRFENRKKRSDPELGAAALSPIAPPDSNELLERKQQGQLLRNALTELTAGERQAIEHAYFSDQTYVEVAARLKQPVGTIKTRIRSGLGKLRQVLMKGAEKP